MATRFDLPPEVQAALERGEFMAALKLLRERTGVDLNRARQLIDQRRRPRSPSPAPAPAVIAPPPMSIAPPPRTAPPPIPGVPSRELSPGEVPRVRSKVGAVLAALLVAWLLWRIAWRHVSGT